jgi:hypothetical protein
MLRGRKSIFLFECSQAMPVCLSVNESEKGDKAIRGKTLIAETAGFLFSYY